MSTMKSTWAPAFAGLAILVSACGTTAPPPPKQQPPADLPTPAPVEPESGTYRAKWQVLEGFAVDTVRDRAMKSGQRLNVAKDLRDACELPDLYFDFDSVEVDADEEAGLANLARCFTRGPLRGQRLSLVGHTDRNGEVSYNAGLGMRRADRVKAILVQHGMPAVRILTSSYGESGVRAPFQGFTDADNRRVDVLISR